jgi:hypothetical protein
MVTAARLSSLFAPMAASRTTLRHLAPKGFVERIHRRLCLHKPQAAANRRSLWPSFREHVPENGTDVETMRDPHRLLGLAQGIG